jgi:hypothetical protein
LLKLKSYTVSKKLPDSVLTAEDSQDQIANIFEAMVGFVTHLNSIVMPDPGQDDDSDEDEQGDAGDDSEEEDEEEEGEEDQEEEEEEESDDL